MKDLFEARASPEAVASFLEEVRTFSGIRGVEVLNSSRDRLVGIAEAVNCDACSALVRSDCFIAGAICRGSAEFEWNLIFRDLRVLRRLVRRLERKGYGVKLVRLADVKDSVALTARQEKILSAALALGYFDYPRRIRLTELARQLGISKSWVSEVLRRAQTKVVDAYFRAPPIEVPRRKS